MPSPRGSTEFPEQTQQAQQHEPSESDSKWVISIEKQLEQASQDDELCSRETVCIYRVPHSLRQSDEKAYVPQLVSLGPYYRDDKRLCQMEHHKRRALHHVLKRTNHNIKLYLEAVTELEERVRDCYQGPISLTSHEFVEMMVLDGCFVLELLQGAKEGFEILGYSPNDPVFADRGSIYSIQRDMMMLENQIPLFILDRLLGLQLDKPDHEKGGVSKLIPYFFDALMPTDGLSPDEERGISGLDLHCLDVFRRRLLGGKHLPQKLSRIQPFRKLVTFQSSPPAFVERRQQLIHCVTELREAGLNFKKRDTDNFWDIHFDNGILQIPRLLIHYGTKSLFLNLVAFEQCYPHSDNKITSYVVFMDNLINSPQDVAHLHYCGIIEHWLGSDAEVADLFNCLCQEVVFDRKTSYLSKLSEDMNDYYKAKWNTWREILKRKYFSNPWAIISLFAALILLLLTSTQTFYGVYGHYKHK